MNKQEIERALKWATSFLEYEEYAKDTYEDTCGTGDLSEEERIDQYEAMDSSINLFKTIVFAIQQQVTGGWIPVEERLPGKGNDVLVTYDTGAQGVDFIDSDGDWFWEDREEGIEVTHWMPMPEAPEPYKEKHP